MTQDRHAYWQAYIDELAAILGRRDWRIVLSDEATDDESNADIWVQDNHYFARIRVKPGWEQETPEEQRYTLVHEIMHLHFNNANIHINSLTPFMSEREFNLWNAIYCDAFECSIDSVSYAVALLLPLPPAPPPTKAR